MMLTRRKWLAATLGGMQATAQEPRRPNIILIVLDDLGSGDLGFMGSKDIPTPHIDALATSGVVCTAAYSTHPFCSPTRAGLMTGRYPQRFGYENNPKFDRTNEVLGLPLDQRTLPQVLQASGYRTGFIGKWHLGATPAHHPNRRGFDEAFGFSGGGHDYLRQGAAEESDGDLIPIDRNGKPEPVFPGYLTTAFTREAVAFIKKTPSRQPFFLYLAYNAPHSPLQAPDSYLQRVRHIPEGERRTYAAMIAAADDGVGATMEAIRARGQEKETLVIFCGDNGGPASDPKTSNGVLRGYKGQLYEGGIRVPYVVSWPGKIAAGSRLDYLVSTLDVFSTACAAAQIPLPDTPRDSVDLMPYIQRLVKGSPHTMLFWRHFEQVWAARNDNWKLVRRKGEAAELYNLTEDPSETRNVAAERGDVVDRIWAQVERWNKGLAPRRF